MSVAKRILFGTALAWWARTINILLSLVLMPVLFRSMEKEELGLWLLMTQTWSVLGILDFGLSVTLTRRIAFARGRSGTDVQAPLTTDAVKEINDLALTGSRAFSGLAVIAFAISATAGLSYLRTLGLAHTDIWRAAFAWVLLSVGLSLTLWASGATCLLRGVGFVGWDAIFASVVTGLTLLLQIAVVVLGGGLVFLALVVAAGAVLQRVLVVGMARRRLPELFEQRGAWSPPLLRSMVAPSLRAGLTTIGLVIVMNSDQLFISRIASVDALPAYRAAYLVLLNLNMLSVMVASTASVFVSHLWQAGDVAQVHGIVRRNLRLGLILMASGGACVLALGPHLFDAWLGSGHFVGYPVLSVFFVLLFLEAQAFIIATSSRATEDEAFVFWSLAAAVLKVLLSLWLGGMWGLIGIASATLLAQVTTNYWYMVYRGLTRLGMRFRAHVTGVLAPAAAGFGVTFLLVKASQRVAGRIGVQFQVALGVFVAGCVCAALLWVLVVDITERRRIVARILRRGS